MKATTTVVIAALALVASAAEAAGRIRPAADTVVLTVPARVSEDPVAVLERALRNDKGNVRLVTELATLYAKRARETHEARYFTRAESLLQPWIAAQTDIPQKPEFAAAPAALLNVQADILQNRHEFAAARELLDRAVRAEPANAASRLLRATVNIVQGRFDEARPDCLSLLALGESNAGTTCLAQVLGGTGRIDEAEMLLRPRAHALDAWGLGVLADLATRRGNVRDAERDLRKALTLEPADEAIRSALCDLLIERGAAAEASVLLDHASASYGLLVRKAHVQSLLSDSALTRTREALLEFENLSERRGDVLHAREQALLALYVDRNVERALAMARLNFETQRETIDIRLLARAALASRDRTALAGLHQWLRATRFEDRSLSRLERWP
jgi:predicted Zn-dependent protease